MLFVAKNVMRLCAVMVGVCVGIGLHALMPGVPWYMALGYFVVLGVAFLFACTLVVASLMIGSAPGRSKLGQKLANKVETDTDNARKVYEQKRAAAKCRTASKEETTVRPPQAK